MDRFKFRIWDIKQQKYRQRTHHEADTCLDCLSGKVLYGEGIEIYGEEDDKDVVLEQCTGLKDKNGQLIYEGDIVNIFCCRHPYGYLGRTKGNVYWSNPDAEFRIKVSSEEEYNLYGIEIEVVGNIHENADLLGEE